MDGMLVDFIVVVEFVWLVWVEWNSIFIVDVLVWCYGWNVVVIIIYFLFYIILEIFQSMVSVQLDQECIQFDSVKFVVGGWEFFIWFDVYCILWGVVINVLW